MTISHSIELVAVSDSLLQNYYFWPPIECDVSLYKLRQNSFAMTLMYLFLGDAISPSLFSYDCLCHPRSLSHSYC